MKFELKKTLRGSSDKELLAELQRCAEGLGRDTITMREYDDVGLGHSSTFIRRFGSWPQALESAGLSPSRSKIGITNEELFDNLRSVWTTLGRQPSYAEIKQPLSSYSAGTYEKRFGTWTKALEAFVHWVNTDDTTDIENSFDTSVLAETTQPSVNRRTKRDISDRQRFRILMRDGFVCTSCGASPLKSRGVELQVDHILPWSKGGETTDDNLATKCAQCNLGKGNAFDA